MLGRFLESIPLDDPEMWRPIVDAMAQAARDSTDPRGAARCASVLAHLRAQNIAIAQHLDKNDRLDEGSPTENLAHTFTATFDKQG